MNHQARRVVVIGPSWIGDMVMTQSLLKALVRVPETKVDVVAPAWTRPLLSRMPEVNASIPVPFERGKLQIAARTRLARTLSRGQYDQAIVLPNSWKSALPPFLARVPLRTGYRGEQRWGLLNDLRELDPSALPMTVQRFVALAGDTGNEIEYDSGLRPALRISESGRQHTMQEIGVTPHGRRILALCPGAEYGPSKRWPADHYASVARAKLDQGWRVWLMGSVQDKQVAGAINTRCEGRCDDLTGRTSIDQAIDMLSLATVVVSNDSGLMHITAAVGRPLVALFGSSDPRHTPPLSATCRVHFLDLPCSPCFQRQCPLKHYNCLQQLAPGRVLKSVDSFLDGST